MVSCSRSFFPLFKWEVMNLKKISGGKSKGKLARRLSVKVEVIFGNPNQGCRGSGICRVSAKGTPMQSRKENRTDRQVTAHLATRGGKLLELKFPLEALSASILEELFGGATFETPAGVILPPAVCSGLGLKKQSAIAAGTYPLLHRKSTKVILLGSPKKKA